MSKYEEPCIHNGGGPHTESFFCGGLAVIPTEKGEALLSFIRKFGKDGRAEALLKLVGPTAKEVDKLIKTVDAMGRDVEDLRSRIEKFESSGSRWITEIAVLTKAIVTGINNNAATVVDKYDKWHQRCIKETDAILKDVRDRLQKQHDRIKHLETLEFKRLADKLGTQLVADTKAFNGKQKTQRKKTVKAKG